ncbi:MAG: hypothetical protein AAF206_15335, partial [Bacteroidota bacterium]
MNKFLPLLLLILLHPNRSNGQNFPALSFQKFYDNLGAESAVRLVRSHDNQLIIGGNTVMKDSLRANCGNVWIIKADTLGELIWEQEITVSGCEEMRDMVLTEDGGILFIGVTSGMIPHRERGGEAYWGDVMVGKLDSVGRLEWIDSYGGSKLDQGFAISQASFGEHLVVGASHSNDGAVKQNHGMSDVWTLKLGKQGELKMSEVVGGSKNDWATCVSVCQNGDYLIAGQTNSRELDQPDLSLYGNGLIMRMTQGGFLVWKRSFTCPYGGHLTDIREAADGRIFVAGYKGT